MMALKMQFIIQQFLLNYNPNIFVTSHANISSLTEENELFPEEDFQKYEGKLFLQEVEQI